MRFRSVILLLLLLAGCRGQGPSSAGPESVALSFRPESTDSSFRLESRNLPPFTPEFSSQPIPPDVEERMRGCSYPEDARIPLSELRYLRLSYVDFEGKRQTGEMVCNQAIAADLCAIFQALYEAAYPIRSIRLVDDFGGSDEASMQADNTSCFNYRTRTGQTRLSNHALGLAVDVNPLENPYVSRTGRISPAGAEPFADRSADFAHKIDREDLCYKLFRAHGFAWGGAWRSSRDYQHFEKP